MPRPLAIDRHGQILQALDMQGSVSVSDLAERFDVSMETIRRDLKLLAEEGRLVTVHGGAHRLSFEPSLSRRTIENAAGKAAIGRVAADYVEEGMAILIDSGSTTLALAQALVGRSNLTVLTNSLPIGLILARTRTIRTLLLGGEIEPNDEAAFGLDTLDLIKRYRVDLAFIGAGGISEAGDLQTANQIHPALKRALAEDAMDKMAENARELGLDKDYARGYVAGMDSKLFASDTSQERVDKAEEQRHEPVAMRWDFDGYGYRYIDSGSGSNWQTRVKDAEPLYDRPQVREWVTLTQEEWLEAAKIAERGNYLVAFQRIQQKLKEKNQ